MYICSLQNEFLSVAYFYFDMFAFNSTWLAVWMTGWLVIWVCVGGFFAVVVVIVVVVWLYLDLKNGFVSYVRTSYAYYCVNCCCCFVFYFWNWINGMYVTSKSRCKYAYNSFYWYNNFKFLISYFSPSLQRKNKNEIKKKYLKLSMSVFDISPPFAFIFSSFGWCCWCFFLIFRSLCSN